jgi:phospholipase C
MQENRSFDHMLGYLSLPPWNRPDVDGLKNDAAWLAKFANPHNGESFSPFRLPNPGAKLPDDPNHDRYHIATQLGAPAADGYPMTGFVDSCPTLEPTTGQPMVMGYFNADDLPTTHFFAQNFAVCDRWFSSIPASTQPNRLMSMAGATTIDNNKDLIPSQKLVYDWLEDRNVRWRVYHDGVPFFALMEEWIPWILMDHDFRDFSRLFADIQNESDDTFPQVIFVEPRFTDAPHIETPTDDHAPSAISPGQAFLAKVYSALTSNEDRWKGTVLVVTYDEHGGFFDHVSPPSGIPTTPPAGFDYEPFSTLGARVPGLVISPLVAPGSVYSGLLDHTSILKFIADQFSGGKGYSPEVDSRKVNSLTDVLTALPAPDGLSARIPLLDSTGVGFGPGFVPKPTDANLTPLGFSRALDSLRTYDKDVAALKFPKLVDRF